ncbi:hypothetical protein [Vibrio crassostreae]|uniref:hypothetical protein n=1 Tax=Vibrio crassostreae TaxID=246167 RepID=UPI000F50219F|nr:hypothetical protein [Vibrio crassostreae]RPF25101.1 hypothetical protein EDB12_0071 [Vibrio crassostreae]
MKANLPKRKRLKLGRHTLRHTRWQSARKGKSIKRMTYLDENGEEIEYTVDAPTCGIGRSKKLLPPRDRGEPSKKTKTNDK